MTNYEKYIQEITEEKLIDMLTFNCIACPLTPCKIYGNNLITASECIKILEEWCKEAEDD